MLVKVVAARVWSAWIGQLKQLKLYKHLASAHFHASKRNGIADHVLSNEHFALLGAQFRIGPSELWANGRSVSPKRLADNFEAYIYALYLDQGMDALGRFLAPILLFYFYRQHESFGFKLKLKEPHTMSKTYLDALDEPHRIEYEGLAHPAWVVPCSDGSRCKRQGCYFYHRPPPSTRSRFLPPPQDVSSEQSPRI